MEQEQIGWLTFDLYPTWLAPVEARVTKSLTGTGVYARYSTEGLLRGDSVARATYYQVLRGIGVLNADEIRAMEDRPPIPGGKGKEYLQPMNFSPLGAPPPQPNLDSLEHITKQKQPSQPLNGKVGATN